MEEKLLTAKYMHENKKRDKNVKVYDSRGYCLEHDEIQKNDLDLKNAEIIKNEPPKKQNGKFVNENVKTKKLKSQSIKKKKPKNNENFEKKSKSKQVNNEISMKDDFYVENLKKIFHSNKDLQKKIFELKNELKKNTKEEDKQNQFLKFEKTSKKLLIEENLILKERIKFLENDLMKVKTEKAEIDLLLKNDFFLQEENSQLKSEIKKLFNMLKQTQQFKEFAAFSDIDGNLRYLQNLNLFPHYLIKNGSSNEDINFSTKQENLSKSYQDDFHVKNTHIVNCDQKTKIKESLKWVPEKCLSILKEVQKDYIGLSDSCIQYILFELNKIWKKREEMIYEKAYIFCKNCKNKTLLRNFENCKLMSDPKKDNLIAELRSKNSNLASRLKSKNKFNNPYNVITQKNSLIQTKLEHMDKKNNFCKNLEKRNIFLEKTNKMLMSILDKNKMRDFFELNGEIKNVKSLKHVFKFIKKNILQGVENIYQNVISENNNNLMTNQYICNQNIKKQIDYFEGKLIKIDDIKKQNFEKYKNYCINDFN